jgi:hypothetical protein
MEALLNDANRWTIDQKASPILKGTNSTTHAINDTLLADQADGFGQCVEGGEELRSSTVQFYGGQAPTQTAPVLDFLQSRHDLLYSRLFTS